jgi:hypothetical protein
MRYQVAVLALVVTAIASNRPASAIADGQADSDRQRNSETIAALNNETEDVDFTEQPLNEVLDWLTQLHPKVRFQFDELTLKNAGMDPTKLLVTLERKKVHLRELVGVILEKSNPELSYTVRDGRVLISTKERLHKSQN